MFTAWKLLVRVQRGPPLAAGRPEPGMTEKLLTAALNRPELAIGGSVVLVFALQIAERFQIGIEFRAWLSAAGKS